MKYDISKSTAPKMPNLGKGLEFVELALSQISPDMREPIAPTLFDAAAAHISGTEFMYPDLTWKELCGLMDALSACFAGGKGQQQGYVEAMMRLESCKGRFIIPQLNRLAEKLAADMAMIADLAFEGGAEQLLQYLSFYRAIP